MTLEQLKSSLRTPTHSGASTWFQGTFEDLLAVALNAAEVAVEDHCGRVFTVAESASREFWPTHETLLEIGDWTALTSITVGDATTLDVDTDVRPHVPAVKPNWPHRGLQRRWGKWHPDTKVTVVADYDWPATPAVVPQCVTMLGVRFFHRLNSPLGVENFAGGPVYIRKSDPDVAEMLRNYAGTSF